MYRTYEPREQKFIWHCDKWYDKVFYVLGVIYVALFVAGFIIGFIDGLLG